jgi:hypothetical protein
LLADDRDLHDVVVEDDGEIPALVDAGELAELGGSLTRELEPDRGPEVFWSMVGFTLSRYSPLTTPSGIQLFVASS